MADSDCARHFPLVDVDVAGRRTLPANEIVKRFDLEAEQPNRQLDFVLTPPRLS